MRVNNLSYQHHYEAASIKQIAEAEDGKLYLSVRADKLSWRHHREVASIKRMADAFELTLRNVELTYNHHVEEIEQGVTAKQQKARDRYGADLLLPIGGALVALPGRQEGPQHDDVPPADLEHLHGKRPAGGDLGLVPGRQPKTEYRPLDK